MMAVREASRRALAWPGASRFNQRASSGESKRKKRKAKRLSFAFFPFLLVFGIGTFQWVTGEKSRKNFPPFSLAHGVASLSLPTARMSPVPAARASACRQAFILIKGICISNNSDFVNPFAALVELAAGRPEPRHGRACPGYPRNASCDNVLGRSFKATTELDHFMKRRFGGGSRRWPGQARP